MWFVPQGNTQPSSNGSQNESFHAQRTFQFAALRCAKLFWTGLTRLTGFREEGVWSSAPDNPVNPVNPVKKTPPCCICGKGEFMFGGTLFVLSPPMRMPIRRNEQTAKRPSAVSERQMESIRAKVSRAMRDWSASKASEAASPHKARRISTVWKIAATSPDPQLQCVNRNLAVDTNGFSTARDDAGKIPVGVEACWRHDRREHR